MLAVGSREDKEVTLWEMLLVVEDRSPVDGGRCLHQLETVVQLRVL